MVIYNRLEPLIFEEQSDGWYRLLLPRDGGSANRYQLHEQHAKDS